jgi:ABC-type transport system involved in cytochrome c biogenesis permease subunit
VQAENAPPMLKGKAENGKISLSVLAATLKEMGGTLSFDDVPPAVREAATSSTIVAFYPPAEKDKTEWATLGHQLVGGMISPSLRDEAIKNMEGWEMLVRLRDQRPEFEQKLQTMQSDVIQRAQDRGQMSAVKIEQSYNKADFYYRALILFVVAFLMLAVSWILPREGGWVRWLNRGAWLCVWLAVAAMIASMVMRGLIVRRPPITNLYETIPFITFWAVLVGLVIERFTRQGILLGVSTFLGVLGLFMTMKYEMGDATDTLAPLQAVLDTNFWLATHVTTINIGYCAGLLASAISALYLLARLVDPLRQDAAFYKVLNTAVYGSICFGLLFSLVGTVLGGLWANDSWGRFWGWDPKENGALMIVLAMLIILHARLAGWIREFGLHQLSLLTGVIVAFSWWHVNLLGVGLHSYGFTAGIKNVVFGYYYIVAAISFLGLIAWVLEKMAPHAARDAAVRPALPNR